MKLSDLLQYKKDLEAMSVKASADHAYNNLHKIAQLINSKDIQFGNCSSDIDDAFRRVNDSFDSFSSVLGNLHARIDRVIDDIRPQYFQESYRLYAEEMVHETTEYILNRRLVDVTPYIYDFMLTRAAMYADWRFPAMIIRPSREDFVERLVGCDPLYLVDQNHDLLRPSIERWTEQYQRRLRTYCFRERDTGPLLVDLPKGQFGLVLAYNFFNFRPFEMIERWLREIYDHLRPGGTLAMTFNNCDLPKGVVMAECHFMCYTPGRMIEQLALTIGYDITFRYDTHDPNTWIELRKPGSLTGFKGGQALAETMSKLYPQHVRAQIIDRANSLGIASTPVPVSDHDFQQLENRIQQHLEKIQRDHEQAERLAAQERERKERQRLVEEQQRLEQIQREQDEKNRREMEESRQARTLEEQAQQRVLAIRQQAHDLGMPEHATASIPDLEIQIQRIMETKEMAQLRQQCVRLKLAETDAIMRKLTLQELRDLFEKWRKENEGSST